MRSPSNSPPTGRAWWAMVLTVAIVGLVLWFVGETLRAAWGQLREAWPLIRWPLLLAAGIAYLVGLLPMAWFWRRVVTVVDGPVDWRRLLVAYYAGHLGKYVPGKAVTIVLRTALLRRPDGAAGPIAVSVFIETLAMMAVGAVVAAVLLAIDRPVGLNSPWLVAASLGLAAIAAASTSPPLFRWVVRRVVSREDQHRPQAISWSLIGEGWVASLASWIGLAASLWLVVVGCGGEASLDLPTCRTLLLATTLPVVAGFLSFVPGGLIVRDALTLRLLAPLIGEAPALAAAAAVRLVWVGAEVAVYVTLVAMPKARGGPSPNNADA